MFVFPPEHPASPRPPPRPPPCPFPSTAQNLTKFNMRGEARRTARRKLRGDDITVSYLRRACLTGVNGVQLDEQGGPLNTGGPPPTKPHPVDTHVWYVGEAGWAASACTGVRHVLLLQH